jgi:hypothetical protein
MTAARQLGLIGLGYVLCFGGGCAAVALNELRMSAAGVDQSSAMGAFGDVVLFIFVVGAMGLAPTWFLLRLAVEKAPRTAVTAVLAAAALGPLSWLSMIYLSSLNGPAPAPLVGGMLLGPFAAFVAIPRIVLGPVLMVIEAATCFMVRGRDRTLVGAAILLDLVPLSLYAAHMASAMLRYSHPG